MEASRLELLVAYKDNTFASIKLTGKLAMCTVYFVGKLENIWV